MVSNEQSVIQLKMLEKGEHKTSLLNNVKNQYFATFAANLIHIGYGCIIGWTSPALPQLASENTPLQTEPLTNEEISWIGSIGFLGGLFGSPFFSYIVALIGSKRAVLSMVVPCIIFWLLIHFGTFYNHIVLARFIAGIGGGGVPNIPMLYVAEIANDNIRGRLGSVALLSRNIGTLIAFILGATVTYENIPYINGVIPTMFVIIFTLLPNTPRYHLRKNQIKKAEKALKYYKGCGGKSQLEENAIQKELKRLGSIENQQKSKEKLQLTDFCNRSAVKGISVGITLVAFSHATAQFTITNYAVIIFNRAGSFLDPHYSSIIVAVSLIFGSLLATFFADILGRKCLNIVSLIGSAVGLFTMALYHYFNINRYDLSSFAWVPVVSLSFVIFMSAAGIIPLSYVCSVEYLPPKIRNIGMAIISFSSNVFIFIFVKLFPILLEMIDLHGYMIICGVFCVAGTIYVAVVLDETSGQPLDDVEIEKVPKTEHA